jgi:Ca-activated chloride channel family protein
MKHINFFSNRRNVMTLLIACCFIVSGVCAQSNPFQNFQFIESMQTANHPFLTLSGGFNNDYFALSVNPDTGYLYIEAKAGKYTKQSARTPLNISLVIDRSGSMSGDKIHYVRKAAEFVVDNLTPDDLLSIVIYDNEVEVLQSTIKVENKAHLKTLIAGITDRGSTNLSGGMLKGYDQVKASYKQGYVNRVLLLSDGLANVGITDTESLQAIAKKMNLENGITLSTFGVGNDFNELLMTNLAEYGSGNYHYIDSPDQIPAIFDKELKGLLSVIGQNSVLEIKLPDFIQINHVFGYKYEQTGNTIRINFRDIFSEENKAVLVRYVIPANTNKDINAVVTLDYDDAIVDYGKKTLALELVQRLTSDTLLISKSLNNTVNQQIVIFESNEMMEQAMLEVDKGNFEDAREIMGKNVKYIKDKKSKLGTTLEMEKQEEASILYEEKIKNVETMDREDLKHVQKASRSKNYEIRKKK